MQLGKFVLVASVLMVASAQMPTFAMFLERNREAPAQYNVYNVIDGGRVIGTIEFRSAGYSQEFYFKNKTNRTLRMQISCDQGRMTTEQTLTVSANDGKMGSIGSAGSANPCDISDISLSWR
jgi:hypothetical protein